MSFKINPAKPEITETVVIQKAEPETVTVTLPLGEALWMAALQGHSNGVSFNTFYKHLGGRLHEKDRPVLDLARKVLVNREYTEGVDVHGHQAEFNRVFKEYR